MKTFAVINLIFSIFMGIAIATGYFSTEGKTWRDTLYMAIALVMFGCWALFSLITFFYVSH